MNIASSPASSGREMGKWIGLQPAAAGRSRQRDTHSARRGHWLTSISQIGTSDLTAATLRSIRLSVALETALAVVVLALVAWLGTLAPLVSV